MSASDLYQESLFWLHKVLGPEAHFHEGQWEAIEVLVQRRQRVLVVQKTGWGKSLVYFLATRLLRSQGSGPTILISPLLSLMRNQIDAAKKLGLRAESINSTNRDDWEQIERALLMNKVDLLLISPERLRNERFQGAVWANISHKVGLVAVDEAHCISDWGHDFRPDYRRIVGLLAELPSNTPILGTTATANDRVVADVAEILGPNLHILRGPLTRESLELYAVRKSLSEAERLVLLVKLLNRIDGSGIIYCTTTQACQLVAEWLQKNGFNARPYFSNVEEDTSESRVELEQQLLNNELKVLVASVALGMGFDKPDLHFVIHYQHPGSIIGYYQQIGRAGRGIDQARIILLHGNEDREIQEYFMNTAFPKISSVQKTIELLRDEGCLKLTELQKLINVRRSTLDKILLHLELEGVVEKTREGYCLVSEAREPDYQRWKQVSMQREVELTQLEAYIEHEGCLMRFIAEALDDPTHVADCGRCQNCTRKPIKSNPTPAEIDAARQFLTQERFIVFEPRKMWPAGGLDAERKGRIDLPNAPGLALCYYNNGGWADYVRQGKYADGVFAATLIEASVQLLWRYWETLDETPAWVTCVPSLRYPNLVADFARQLSVALELPFVPVIQKLKERPPQVEMQNMHYQAKNLVSAFAIAGKVSQEPVLLVDDMVDSGWTLALVGELLRRHGSGVVYPFVLAKMGR